jgi:RNA polymerase sigma-70 factor, ECF subfamily
VMVGMEPAVDKSQETRFKRALVCQPALRSLIVAMTRDFQAAEDILQETMLQVLQAEQTFHSDVEFCAWAKGVARNMVRRHWAQKQRQPTPVAAAALEQLADALVEENEPPEIWADERRMLQNCLGRLSARSRKLFLLRYGDGLKGPALAQAADMNVHSLRTTLLRIREGLRGCLRRGLAWTQGRGESP